MLMGKTWLFWVFTFKYKCFPVKPQPSREAMPLGKKSYIKCTCWNCLYFVPEK